MMRGLSEALRGIGGGYELSRVIGFAGGVTYIVGAHVFIAWNLIDGRHFDLTEYCIAFPGGLGVVGLAAAGAVAIKDRNVASAKKTEASAREMNL